MSRLRHFIGMTLGFLVVATPPLAAATDCSASCGCYCDSSYNECSIFCGSPGWIALCQNGFCDGPNRQCCCYFFSFNPPAFYLSQCTPSPSCGFPPPVQCALTEFSSAEYSKAECAALTKPGKEDHWYFLSYQVDAKGAQSFRIASTSHRWFTDALQGCAARGLIPPGWIPPHVPKLDQGFLIQSDFFEYIPAADSLDVTGRLVRLTFPKLADLSGDLAIRLKTSPEGEVLEKTLLFSSNRELGRLVVEHFEAGLEIAKTGKGEGPFIDILTLKFQNGEMAVLGQTHHAKPRR